MNSTSDTGTGEHAKNTSEHVKEGSGAPPGKKRRGKARGGDAKDRRDKRAVAGA